jgi:hypothetical protein
MPYFTKRSISEMERSRDLLIEIFNQEIIKLLLHLYNRCKACVKFPTTQLITLTCILPVFAEIADIPGGGAKNVELSDIK